MNVKTTSLCEVTDSMNVKAASLCEVMIDGMNVKVASLCEVMSYGMKMKEASLYTNMLLLVYFCIRIVTCDSVIYTVCNCMFTK
jgi:hypothetical protein